MIISPWHNNSDYIRFDLALNEVVRMHKMYTERAYWMRGWYRDDGVIYTFSTRIEWNDDWDMMVKDADQYLVWCGFEFYSDEFWQAHYQKMQLLK
jgi:hypothetical protein